VFSGTRLTFVLRECQQCAAGSFLVAKVVPFYLLLTSAVCTLAIVCLFSIAANGQETRIGELDQRLKDFKLKRSGINLIYEGEQELRK